MTVVKAAIAIRKLRQVESACIYAYIIALLGSMHIGSKDYCIE